MLGLLPPGRKPKEGGYAYFVVLALSALLADADEAVVQMVRDWSPSRTQNPELLALIGEGRGVKRGSSESFASYRARVVGAADFWRLGGTVAGVVNALEAAGYRVTVTEHYHTDRRRWAEFSVELYPGETGVRGRAWGDASGSWGNGAKWGWNISEAEQQRILEVIGEMKAAHSNVRDVWYVLGGPKRQWGDDRGTWGDGGKWHGFDPIKLN